MPTGTARTRTTLLASLASAARLLAAVLLLAGCNLSLNAAAEPQPTDRLHTQARDALDRWAQAVHDSGGASIAFVGDLTGQIGDWEPSVGDNDKRALSAGLVRVGAGVSSNPPARDKVRWTDGSSVDVNLLSATKALDDLIKAASGSCAECKPLLVTRADLASTLVQTTRGPANAPTWVYSIDGSAVVITRVAVDQGVTVSPPEYSVSDPPVGISIEAASGSSSSTQLTVSFTGAPDSGAKACGADYTAEAVESDLAVVVIVNERRNTTPGSCSAVGKTRTARVTLQRPLGDRAVLEVRQGLPVPLTAP